MARSVHDDVLDAALNYIKNNTDKLVACSAQPTTYTEANSTYALADVAVSSSDFTVADDTSGRKVTAAQQDDVDVDATGSITHYALLDTGSSKLLFVTTATSKAVEAGDKITINAFDINLQDPVAP